MGQLLVWDYLTDPNLLHFVLSVVLPCHMIPESVSRTECEVTVWARKVQTLNMLTLNMVLDMTLHLERFLTMRTEPGPARIKLPVVDKEGLDQIVQSCKGKLESFAMQPNLFR